MLDGGGRLGLSLRLADALVERLGLWDEIGRSDNDLDLERISKTGRATYLPVY